MGKTLYLLYESASGYGLFERVKSEEIGVSLEEVQQCITDLTRFSKIMKLKAFLPFKSAENALENINAISEGEVTPYLASFLEMQLPTKGESSKVALGITDPKVGNNIQEGLGIKCKNNELVMELMRGIRLHFDRFIKGLSKADLAQAQLGLGHSYSRCKVKFNVHKVDNMIVQSIALLDQLDKDLNTFSMRVREWYSWHFPELVRIVNNNFQFCQLARLIKSRDTLTDASVDAITEVVDDPEIAKKVIDAAKKSMGSDISGIDMINIEHFATRVVELTQYRKRLHTYLCDKMNACAPNVSALIGELVGARLISHAGSLTSLAKYPASTVQILGAEKALFRALKTRGNTPKYGLIFHSTFIGQAKPKNKGRISRYLANKCSLASRIDCFHDESTNKFGLKLKQQVEERLEFYKTGKAPRKNLEVMREAIAEVKAESTAVAPADGDKKKKSKKAKKDKKRKAEEAAPAAPEKAKKVKKSKKKKSKKA